MEWVLPMMASALVALLVLLAVAVLGALLVVALAGSLLPATPLVGRARFGCPYSKLTVDAEFVSWPGAESPADVQACSAFEDPAKVTCEKRCLQLARTGAVSSP